MKRHFLALLLSMTMIISLLPVTAMAQDSIYPAIEGPALGSANILTEGQYYLLDGDGVPKTDGASAENYNIYYHDTTVTLNNAELKTPLYIPGGTTIEFLGVNSCGSEENPVSTCIQTMTAGNLTIIGTGSYTGYSTSGDGIIALNASDEEGITSNIIINGGNLDLSNIETSINARYGKVEIRGNAEVKAWTITSENNNVEISGDAKVNAQKIDADQKVIIKENSKVDVNGIGIYGDYGIEVTENAEVSALTTSVSLNAFYGPILINSTKKLTAKTTIANGAAIAAGVSQSKTETDVTIKSEVEVEGFVGIAANGTNSNVVIDGGNVTAKSPFIGLYTQANEAPGIVAIKNDAVVKVIGAGNQTPGIATYNRNPQPINIENSSVIVENCGYGLSGSTINLKNSAIEVSSSGCAFLATPTLDYTYGCGVLAGETKDSAQEVLDSDADAATFQNKYVKITPKAITGIVLDKSEMTLYSNASPSSETLTASLEPAGITGKVTWTSSDPAVATVDENGVVTAVANGTATITASIGDLSATCEVTVTSRSSHPSSGSTTAYPVSVVDAMPSGGKIESNRDSASKGATVTITVRPEEGYELGSLTILDKNGNVIDYKSLGDDKYSFVMPNSGVSVEASFVKVGNTGFADVPANAYFADAVEWAVENGVTNGLSDTMFGPYESCTRAQIVTFLWRAAGSPEPTSMSMFTDVPASAYYAKAVAWAVENGITNGMTETTFAPDETCTRGQSVTFLHRALKGTASGSANFTDVASDAFYADAVNWAVANNVTNGTSATTFSPNADCTRAEIVTFLYRANQGK